MSIKVSVIIPTYSRPNNLIRAIESVLNQSYSNLEIIVVDDNGRESKYQKETEVLLRNYVIKSLVKYVIHEININGAAARNTGVKHASGEVIAFLDDDDVFDTKKIELQVEELYKSENQNCKAVYCNSRIVSGKRVVYLKNSLTGRLTQQLLSDEVVFNSSTLMIYRDVFLQLGGFDETFFRHQDWEFLIRYFRSFDIGITAADTYLVTKYRTDNVISRNPYKIVEYREKFLSAFDSDIKACQDSDKIMYSQYIQVVKVLLRFSYFKEGIRYLLKSCSYKNITMKDITHVAYSFFLGFKNSLKMN